jgi:MoxR-like ATPase
MDGEARSGREAVSEAGSGLLRRGADVADRLRENVERVVIGKRDQVELVLTALACRGHVLLEDVPGTAKTVLARALSGSIDSAVASRIQCTPDLQPTDVTGLLAFDPRSREFEFRPGPVFANVLLVDEINRAMPKTQSALLEAMAESQVTVDGVTRPLPDPFLLIATENPIEQEGTFPLPEAQLDRFFLRTSLGYPREDEELRIVRDQHAGHPLTQLVAVASAEDVSELQRAVEEVYVDELLQRWIVALVRATRELDFVAVGASVRGSLALERAVRAYALVQGREYAEADDVERLFGAVILHRLLLEPASLSEEEVDAAEIGRRVWRRCLDLAPRPEPTWSEPADRAAPDRP